MLERVSLVVDRSASRDAHLREARRQLQDLGVEAVAVTLEHGESAALEALTHEPEAAHAVVVLSAHIAGGPTAIPMLPARNQV